jgi:hypothetical protein
MALGENGSTWGQARYLSGPAQLLYLKEPIITTPLCEGPNHRSFLDANGCPQGFGFPASASVRAKHKYVECFVR